MEMEHVKMLKNDLEHAITVLVQNFEAQTRLEVISIDKDQVRIMGLKPNILVTTLFK